jgi:hypothetical protein
MDELDFGLRIADFGFIKVINSHLLSLGHLFLFW